MTTDRPKRSGFLANLSAALTPAPIEDDDLSKPLVVPNAVKGSSVLAILGGLVFLFIGGYSVFTLNSGIQLSVDAWNKQIVECQEKVGGIGDKVTATPAADQTDLANTCKQYRVLTDADISSAKNQGLVTGVLVVVMGIAAAASGWFIRQGAKWAKRVLMGVVVLAFAGTLLLGISNPILMVSTLLLAVALMLTFIGKGSTFFARADARRKPA